MKAVQQLTTKNTAFVILKNMENCKGIQNAISSRKLFKRVFGEDYQSRNLVSWYKAQTLYRAINYLRTKTHCFVIYARIEGQGVYYVPTGKRDLEPFFEQMENIKDRADMLMDRAEASVEQKWHLQKWDLRPTDKLK